MIFQVKFTPQAEKDLKSLSRDIQATILEEAKILKTSPFPFKKKIKKIKDVRFPCYRLRIDLKQDSFRLSYGIEKELVFVLKIISKKDADRVMRTFRKIDFPPNV